LLDTLDTAQSNSPPAPAELCGYTVAGTLSENKSYLSIGPSGRGLVLKKLDEECLVRSLLHPSIRERLCRVRELPHGGIANLHGVGRDHDAAYLIWEYVEGVRFDQYATAPNRSPRELAIAARELALATASLHLLGIVHGDLVAGNIFVLPGGSIRLTHVSPLLYSDPAVDADSVLALLSYVVEKRSEMDTPLGRMIANAQMAKTNLRDLGAQLAAFIESRETDALAPVSEEAAHIPRRRAFLGAAAVAVVGIAITCSIWLAVHWTGGSLPRSLHLSP
jgi:serine/threonine protein kinase